MTIQLVTTSQSLQVSIEATETTNKLQINTQFTDVNNNTGTSVLGTQDAQSNGATPVTTVSAPASGHTRSIGYHTVQNLDTVSHIVTVNLNISGGLTTQVQTAIAPGQLLSLTPAGGWALTGTILVSTGVASSGGTVTANAGINLNTSALALESGGNLATLAGMVSGTKGQFNIAQWNGHTPIESVNGAPGVGGDTATGVADTGNPVKVGGYGSSTTPSAVTGGQRANGWFNLNGASVVAILSNAASPGDASTGGGFWSTDGATNRVGLVGDCLYNGTNWDRRRNNVDASASLATISAQAAGTVTSADQTNYNGHGVQLGINITALGAATTVTVTIQGKDAVSGTYYTILASAALATTGFTRLSVFPGLGVSTNSSANDVLPRTWRVSVVVGGSNTATATIGASVLV
jgi:hypothetical protein